MEWMSVKEKLPECLEGFGASNIVLVCDAWGRIGFGIYQDGTRLNASGWFSGTDSVRIDYWASLPEPPKESPIDF